jgi:hypothetical protein
MMAFMRDSKVSREFHGSGKRQATQAAAHRAGSEERGPSELQWIFQYQ